jgi:heavy metal sensor kinase
MKLSIRARLTLWFSSVVALIILLLGLGIFYGATWGLQSAADLELKTGLDGVAAFIQKKFVLNQMGNLTDELQEHSSLLPRGKMLRVRYVNGPLVYEAEAMKHLELNPPGIQQTLRQSITVNNRPFRAIGKDVTVGPNLFQIEIAVDQTEYAELKDRLIWLLIFSLPAGVLLAAFAGYWTSNRILIPLNRITETASSIDARNLNRGLPLSGTNDELDRLSKTLNHMLERIHASYERIAQFTADASHELRTPVTLIRSNAELLLMEAPRDSRLAVGLSDVLSESEYMAQLISDLLTLARADGTGTSLAMELFELAESADAVLARARALAATKDISFHYLPLSRVAPLYGNQSSLERVIMIFIDNAVRYTPAGGSVTLETWTDERFCGFTVSDAGIGLAPEDHHRIFQRFYRVDTARTPRDGGTGLGLAIARGLLEAHHGRITVASQLGHGASFRVAFPRADVEPALQSQWAEHELCSHPDSSKTSS